MATKIVLTGDIIGLQVGQWYLLIQIEMRKTFMLKKLNITTLMVTPYSNEFERNKRITKMFSFKYKYYFTIVYQLSIFE